MAHDVKNLPDDQRTLALSAVLFLRAKSLTTELNAHRPIQPVGEHTYSVQAVDQCHGRYIPALLDLHYVGHRAAASGQRQHLQTREQECTSELIGLLFDFFAFWITMAMQDQMTQLMGCVKAAGLG